MRHLGKQALTIALWLALATSGRADTLVTTIVTDPLTGVAIGGYDAVTYFTDPEPREGKPDFEYIWQGVPWYFASAANRDVFIRNPEVYAPQFGGHCVTSLARGYLSDGKPRLYVIEALKLMFFYSTANRDAFLMSKAAMLKAASENWPRLSTALSGPRPTDVIDAALASSSMAVPDQMPAPPASETSPSNTLPSN